MTKIQIINNGNSITTVTYDGDTIIFEVNDKPSEDEIFDEPTSNPLELIKDYAIKEGYASVNEVKKVLGEKVLDVKITDDLVDKIQKDIGKYFKPVPLGYKWEKYRKKEIDKNRRLRKELKKARKKIAELKVKPKLDEEIAFSCPNRFEYIFKINSESSVKFTQQGTFIYGEYCIYFYMKLIQFMQRGDFYIFKFLGLGDTKSDTQLKELIELNPNYKVEFV